LFNLVYRDKKRTTSLEKQRKPSIIRKENFFGISKSFDIGRYLENVSRMWPQIPPYIRNLHSAPFFFATPVIVDRYADVDDFDYSLILALATLPLTLVYMAGVY